MTELEPDDGMTLYAPPAVAEAFAAELEAASDPGERAAVVAKYRDGAVGGHWGELQAAP